MDQIWGIGADDMVGGMKDIVGGTRSNPRMVLGEDMVQALSQCGCPQSVIQQVAEVRAAGGVAVVDRSMNTRARQPLPITPISIAAAGVWPFQLRPQRLFRVETMKAWSGYADNFIINALDVGQDNQFVAQGSMPAGIWSEVSTDMALRGSTANLGNDITLTVTNTDAGLAQTFGGALVGAAVY